MNQEDTILVINQAGTVVNAEEKAAEESTEKAEQSVSAERKAEETAEESETSEESQDQDGDDESDSDQEDDEGERKDAEKKNRKNGLSKRFKRFKRDITARDEEIARLRAELDKRSGAKPDESKKEQSEEDQEPQPKDFETVGEYAKALTKWEIRQEKAARDAEDKKHQVEKKARERQEGIKSSYNKRLSEFKEQTQDFDNVVADFMEEHGDFQASPAILEAIMSSDVGPAIFYSVLKTPGEYERLSQLSEATIIRELGKIEARISTQAAPSKVPKVSKAPAPAKPLGGSGGSGKKSIFDKDLSQSEYERLREEQEKNRKY